MVGKDIMLYLEILAWKIHVWQMKLNYKTV